MLRSFLHPVTISLALSIGGTLVAASAQASESTNAPVRRLRAQDVFAPKQKIVFQDDFKSRALDRWNFSENDQYALPAASPERIRVVDAPGLAPGSKAVRFAVPRSPGSFRSEISLPYETGFQERWYAARVLIPEEWVFDPNRAADIVLQWHAIPGNWRATYPNLAISISNDHWDIRQSFGSPQTKPTRTSLRLEDPVQRGVWVSWIIHAKWSPREEGLVQIWKDGKLVMDRPGANVYGTIGVDYTPYLKTGIYRPEWRSENFDRATAQDHERPVASEKVVYVTDLKVGNKEAGYADFVSAAEAARKAKP